ncbi:hypothetical protein P7C70_g5608, partial [Phenoliferia sp. Uapishka_3]
MSSPSHLEGSDHIERNFGAARRLEQHTPTTRPQTLTSIGAERLSETPPHISYRRAPRYTAHLAANDYRRAYYNLEQDSSESLTTKLGEAASQLSAAFWERNASLIKAIGRYIRAGTMELASRIEASREEEEIMAAEQALAEAQSVAGGTWEDWE